MIRIALSTLALMGVAFAAQADEPTRVPATFNKVYVPQGFDSNDNVQIVGEGMFRNTCYRPALTTVEVNHEEHVVRVGPAAYEYSGLCLQVILPFERVLDVGILKAGNYDVVLADSGKKLGEIPVRPAVSNTPDEYLYAPISQAFYKQSGGNRQVVLSGEFLTNCLALDEVKVQVQPDVIVLQPIAKVIRTHGCLRGKFPFTKVVQVQTAPKGRYLLHVRSLNGNSINSLVEVN